MVEAALRELFPEGNVPAGGGLRRGEILRAAQRKAKLSHRPIRTATTLPQPSKTIKPKRPCQHFIRTGKCQLGEQCPFEHDPSRVYVCRNFLKGACEDDHCLLMHECDPVSGSAFVSGGLRAARHQRMGLLFVSACLRFAA